MEICFVNQFAASAWLTEAGKLVVVSKADEDQIHLLHFQIFLTKGRVQPFLLQQIDSCKAFKPLDARSLRSNLSSNWGALLTKHLLALHKQIVPEIQEVVSDTAWRYSTLIAWGEASAARELSLELDIPVRTIQNRLRIARERGILNSPGPGSRLGR